MILNVSPPHRLIEHDGPRFRLSEGMKSGSRISSPGLAKGQMWRTNNGYIEIIELGKKVVFYRVKKQKQQTGVLTRMIRVDALQVYLRASAATLVS